MRTSRAQTPSLAHREQPDPDWGPGFDIGRTRPPSIGRQLADMARNRSLEPDRGVDRWGR